MKQRFEQRKILFHAGRSNPYPGTESMWGTVLGNDRFELDTVPARICDISYQDVFEAFYNASSGALEFFRVRTRSANATYRFDFTHATEPPSTFIGRLRDLSFPKVVHCVDDVYLSLNVPTMQARKPLLDLCRALNRANVIVGCSSDPNTPLMRNEESPPDAMVCYHVLRDRKPVLSVGRYDDGGWDIDCGEVDHDTGDLTMTHSWHVFTRDITLNEVIELTPGYGVERDSLGEPWDEPVYYEEYCEEE